MRPAVAALALLASCPCSSSEAPDKSEARIETVTQAQAAQWRQRFGALEADLLDREGRVNARIRLSSLLTSGRPTLVSFFATYCPPCVSEMATLSRLHDEGHAIAGVSLDTGNVLAVRRLIENQPVSYPIAVLTSDALKAIGAAIDGLPTNVIFDGGGTAIAVLAGESQAAQLRAVIDRAHRP